jgi:ubiquinone/menaquinone biosynthesis C-methylase UbiE
MGKFKHGNVNKLLGAERRREIDPDGLLRSAGLKDGDAMADIGCGPGFFALPAAAIVGETGRVYALDTEPRMLDSLRELSPPLSVEPMVSGEQTFPIDDACVDFVLLAYVLHEAEDRGAFLKEASRITRPGGRLLLIDWEKQVEERGPPVAERLSREDSATLLEAAGFTDCAAGSVTPSHYRISAAKPS